ncbi:PH domain-containing protein [Patescibacteria group bacterium]|nr:PH domain-containing protein [Patescibacteria group bacterium]
MPFIFSISKNSFEGQLAGEKTVLATRKHWFVLFFPFWAALFLALLPFLIYFFINNYSWYSAVSSLFWFLVIIYFLILWVLLFYQIMLYVLTVTVITNKRLIRIETKSFFMYERDEMELNKIQDISVKIEGIFASFLNFGDLEVQTAGTIVKFTFPQLPNPQKIKEIIMGLPR